jgi:hypothetical protein
MKNGKEEKELSTFERCDFCDCDSELGCKLNKKGHCAGCDQSPRRCNCIDSKLGVCLPASSEMHRLGRLSAARIGR